MAVVFVFPVPPYKISPNGRGHSRYLAKPKKKYKDVCLMLARAMVNDAMGGVPPKWKLATIQYTAQFKAQVWDDDNLIGAMKYARDALADAGFVENDRSFITLPVASSGYCKNPRVIVTIAEA